MTYGVAVRLTLWLLAAGVLIAIGVYAVSGGRVLFLPILLLLPLAFIFRRRSR